MRDRKLIPLHATTFFGQSGSSNTQRYFNSVLFLYVLAAPNGNAQRFLKSTFHARVGTRPRENVSFQADAKMCELEPWLWMAAGRVRSFLPRALPIAFERPYGPLCSVQVAAMPRAALCIPGWNSIESLTLFRNELIDAFRFSEHSRTDPLFAEFFLVTESKPTASARSAGLVVRICSASRLLAKCWWPLFLQSVILRRNFSRVVR
ncbi:hypothetical protein TRVL_10413 [Trypanosoma vivax]|nr:hypothetical protein TRVL_10413 [Trypanosoma vivax]